jgi:hypothetical protein
MRVGTPGTGAWLVAMATVAAACGQGNGSAGAHSPSPARVSPSAQASAQASPSTAPQPVTGAYGVLYGSQAASTYTVSIVGIDGKVAASADASTPAVVNCGSAAAALVSPPVSMSDSRVYFMDAQGAVFFLAPGGTKSQGPIITLPAPTAARRSMFAVSPDDATIAVVVDDFTAAGATTRLYMDDLNVGGRQNVLLYSETGAFTLWPVGWHGTNNLVVAKVPSCTQGGGPFCCGPQELHVVDPTTADRRFVIGSSSACVIAGPPSPAGAVCANRPDFTSGAVLNWTAGTVRTLAFNGPAFSYLSPTGQFVAFVDNSGTSFTIGAPTISGMFACTWIDDTHVLSGGDTQHQPRVAEVINSKIVPVAAAGDCAGRLPGGL